VIHNFSTTLSFIFRIAEREYSDTAIQAMYTIRQVFNLRLRQTEGFTKSILKITRAAFKD
jgi:hypothetical protein